MYRTMGMGLGNSAHWARISAMAQVSTRSTPQIFRRPCNHLMPLAEHFRCGFSCQICVVDDAVELQPSPGRNALGQLRHILRRLGERAHAVHHQRHVGLFTVLGKGRCIAPQAAAPVSSPPHVKNHMIAGKLKHALNFRRKRRNIHRGKREGRHQHTMPASRSMSAFSPLRK